ncbi:MAG: hypothetical protein RLZZ179_262 [Verrucomicrobiota bacterium]|jgi:ATP-dependent helicase HepA
MTAGQSKPSPGRFVTGQRWLSQTEPELGLGLVINTETDRVTIHFPSTETTRVYTVENPPLTRVKFSVGDGLKTQEGKSFTVEGLEETAGTVTYLSRGKRIEESRLSDSLTFSKPYDRLLNAQVEEKQVYNLRHRALYRRFKTYRAPLRGLLSGRFTPRAHQLNVAAQATRFQHPRVLLADEPGLGKMVEAGLILQRLQTFGAARRVLLLSPAADMETNLTEFSRRFGFGFQHITAADFEGATAKKAAAKKTTAKSAKAAQPVSVFADPAPSEEAEEELPECWFAISLEDLCAHRARIANDAAQFAWDATVVMGADALHWSEDAPNAAWSAVDAIARTTASLILLSCAGPEVDAKHHFGRLHLLDPEAFSSPRKYSAHRKELEPLEAAITKLLGVTSCDREADALLKPLAAGDARLKELHKLWKDGREDSRDSLIDHLLDGHEAGRFVFRNTRAHVPNLPVREPEFIAIEAKPEVRDAIREEFRARVPKVPAGKGKPKAEPSAVDAPITQWILGLVNPPPPPVLNPGDPPPPPPPPLPRLLILTSSRARAVAVEKALRSKVEGTVELVTDAPRGDQGVAPQLIVCGDDDLPGRTFPKLDGVVLWDTPASLCEVRARLFTCDNSFQGPIRILLPVIPESPQELTGRWLHEGLAAFTTTTAGQLEAHAEFAKAAHDLAKRLGPKPNPKIDEELKALSKKTAAASEAAQKRLDKHRDAFLEAVSYRPYFAEQALTRMTSSDDDESLDLFMNRTLETLGILVETKGPRIVFIKPNPESTFHFELVPKEGMTFAYHRAVACTREDAHFLTWDHPYVAQAIDRLLVTAIGNTAYVVWEDERAQIVLLEGIYLATPRSSPHDHLVTRYMPPTPVRVVISHEFEDMSSEYTSEVVNKMVRNGRREWIRNNARPLHNILPGMMRNLSLRADQRMRELAAKAAVQMEAVLNADITRLRRLPETKRRKAAIARIEEQIAATKPLFADPMLTCDQLRLVRRGPSGKGI